ncbi:MAG: type II toxin-antitoxin system RelE/ParE family toxin [Holosporales bacterium]|nr:type II toxin-antitoxin system RelE/ParE family toxin [Holosporales bacterium]
MGIKYVIRYIESIKNKYFQSIAQDKRILIKRVIDDKLTTNPRIFGKPLAGSLKGHYRLRIGNYRVIYRVNDDVVTVVAIGHRKAIYDDYR